METLTSDSYAKQLHLPPRDAWKNPDRWLRPLHSSEKLNLPLDDRGFVKTDDAVDMVMDLFHPWHKFEYDPDNIETRDDVHHFYGTHRTYELAVEELLASEDAEPTIPMEFRNLPTNMGLMYRQIHNTFHLKTNLIPMPELEFMAGNVRNYKIGKQILNKLVKAAEGTIEWQDNRAKRRNSIRHKPEIIRHAEIDAYGEKILDDMYNRHFGNMVSALHEFKSVDNKELIMPNGQVHIEHPDPHLILLAGKAASHRAINYANQSRAS